MALDIRPNLRPEHRMFMTPQLQQAIKLLQLSRLELIESVQTELLENPGLELDEGPDTQSIADRQADVEARANSPEAPQDPVINVELSTVDQMLSPDWQQYLDNHANERHDIRPFEPTTNEDASDPWNNRLTKKTTLEDHLIWQLRLSKISDREAVIGLFIIGNLDDEGYLAVTLDEICAATQATVGEVELVLKRVQCFDPVGVAARDLRECLLVQLESLGHADSLAARVVSRCLAHLGSKRYEKIARELQVSLDQVLEALGVIISLEPKPSRGYEQDEAHPVVPDVFVEKNGDETVVNLNDADVPRLHLSTRYQSMAGPDSGAEEPVRQYLKEKLRAAKWFIDSIEQRQKTLRKVTQSIFKFQRAFLQGGVSHLKPLVLREVAADVGVHESTVSRTTSNKWVSTPHGIFELKWFFQNPVSTTHGDIASASVKAIIRDVIYKEDPQRPHSDEHIVALLSCKSINMARRTVAKYREAMGIL
ncbi:MAG: RNA polymerase factor sigma-54, partial [Candidatus Binatia bacterium]